MREGWPFRPVRVWGGNVGKRTHRRKKQNLKMKTKKKKKAAIAFEPPELWGSTWLVLHVLDLMMIRTGDGLCVCMSVCVYVCVRVLSTAPDKHKNTRFCLKRKQKKKQNYQSHTSITISNVFFLIIP